MEVALYVGASDMVRVWPDDVPYMERFVRSEDFDRILAERDTLQELLNTRDEEVGRLRNSLRLLIDEEAPSYHDCTDNGLQKCAWCVANNSLENKS